MTEKTGIKIRIKNYKIRIFLFMIMLFCINIFIVSQNTKAQYLGDLYTVIDDMKTMDPLMENKTNFNKLVKEYCTTMILDYKKYEEEGALLFDPRKSIFMYMLCSNVFETNYAFYIDGNDGILQKNEEKGYIKYEKDKEGNIYNVLENKLPDYYEDTEDYIQTLFDSVIASYTTLYQANIYGVTGNPDASTDKLIENFGERYYSYAIDESTPFVSICASDKEYSYPKTCKKMKAYIKAAKNTLNNSDNILNSKAIYNKIGDKDKKDEICNKKNKDKYDMISCGLYTDINSFSNLLYNELLFYSTFAEYYSYALKDSPKLKNTDMDNLSKVLKNQEERIDKISNNLNNSKRAIKTTINMLMDLQMTFPIHIGLLMYAESINNFATVFNKTLPPIYTIGDIFRNVQIKK